VVSEPEIHSPAEAAAYLRAVRQLVRYLGVSDGNMEEGSLRCDASATCRRRRCFRRQRCRCRGTSQGRCRPVRASPPACRRLPSTRRLGVAHSHSRNRARRRWWRRCSHPR
jgi:Asp-tRNA(Asn)/Glu-tRNA(Gln) amidotransferase B subunit